MENRKIQTRGFVSAFPGCGKTTIHMDGYRFGLYPMRPTGHAVYRMVRPAGVPAVFDSDSSTYDKEYFPGNYIKWMVQTLQNNILDGFVALVSSHDNVRLAMQEAGLPYTLVYPDRSLKSEYIERYKKRGSPDAFITMMENKWDDFIDSCESDPADKIVLQAGQYLVDVL
ncbi:hypothetical protein Acj133p029 [Acinetobacter phage 133]|uniref:Uncharacterized protein n=1 Tax=Acinetobacter phage 133 TaxID=2919552 RepID=D9I5Z5_9CAUD|nr:hypothetical protein Acj133p029 [Acinetobacter phage 133]ADJ19376.1 conserved hypothetical protein [Acinetobacter phage 133]